MTRRSTTTLLLVLFLLSLPASGCREGCGRSPDGARAAASPKDAAAAPDRPPAWIAEPTPTPQGRALSAREVLALAPYTEADGIGAAVEKLHAGDAAGCAAELQRWLSIRPDTALRTQGTYLLGVCHHYAGRNAEAAALLVPLVGEYPLLADYVRYFAAKSLAALDRTDEALVQLRAIPADSSQARRALELHAEILAARGDSAALAELLGDALRRLPRASTDLWVLYARSLEQTGRPRAAWDAWRDLWANHPTVADGLGIDAELARLARALPKAEREELARPDVPRLLVRLRKLYAAHRSKRAIATAQEVRKAAERGSDGWCEATHLAARSWDKLRTRKESVPLYDALLKDCEHHESRVDVLFFGGKSAHQEGLRERALDFFAKLHREFPEHSYNDDSLLREADIQTDLKRPDKARAALERALAEYPDGDMHEEVAWLLLWDAWRRGDWAEAAKQANRNLALSPRETSYRSAGRTLYWKGRALDRLGETEAAEESWRAVLATYPLTWYAGMAYARLRERDPERAAATLAEVVAADHAPPGPLADDRPLPVTATPAFQRGLELLRLGLASPAQRELEKIGRGATDPAADWLLAALYAKVGDWPKSHNVARRERGEFAEHYPTGDHAVYWRIAYPMPYATLADRAGAAEGVPPALVHSIMREESGFSPTVESWANAVGLMQLLVPTAKDLRDPSDPPASRTSLQDPRLNVKLGTRFLGRLLRRFGGHPALAAAGYNAGVGRLKSWTAGAAALCADLPAPAPIDEFVERIPFSQTRGYTKRVMESYLRYRFLYGPDAGTMTVLPLALPARDAP